MTEPRKESNRRGPRARWLVLSLGTLAGAVAVLVLLPQWQRARWGGGQGPGGFLQEENEWPPYAVVAEQVDPADFLGADACATCHASEHERWAASTHGRAGGPPEPGRVLAPFDGTPIVFADARVTPDLLSSGDFAFVVEWNETVDTLVLEGIVGGGHMQGGGTQGSFTRGPDGTLRFLPFDWSRDERTWFCSLRHPTPGEWRRITPELRLTQCADWPPRRALGQVTGSASCDTCHGSQIRTEFDPETGSFRTRFTSLAVNCESCHGPGREHVERVEGGAVVGDPDLGFESLGTLSEDGSLNVCFRCHATRLTLNDGDLSGEELAANVSLLLPQLTDRPFLPDGRVASFAYQLNHIGSSCYLDGRMTCVSCHEPHGQTYHDEYERPLSGRFDDGQCLGCHTSKADQPERHTRHPAASAGSSCVACHMPYLQPPSVGDDIRYGRSDHTIPVPRPGLDERFGIVNACSTCHTDEGPEALARQVAAEWGTLKPWRAPVQGLGAAPGVDEPARAAELLLQPGAADRLAQAAGLSQYILRFLRPDMESLPPGVQDRFTALLDEPDLDVAALAAAGLHLAHGDDDSVRDALSRRMDALGDDAYRFRDRWGAALRYVGDAYRGRQAYPDAARAYQRALEAVPRHAGALEGLGTVLLARGDGQAEAVLAAAVAADPTRASAAVSLALALGRLGRADEEMAALEEAARRFPFDPLAQFQLGNARLRRRDLLSAADAFRRTLELDEALASPRVGLAQVLAAQGRTDEARSQLRLALEFEPGNAQALELLERLEGL